MRILVACEFSGRVRDAFIRKGHEAVSCDFMDTEVPGPHIQGDAIEAMEREPWDMVIAFPPCTYLSRVAARWLYPKSGVNEERLAQGWAARAFFMRFLESSAPRVAVENPTPFKVFELPKPTQVIQPYEYGEPYSKRTLLWIRGLPALEPTEVLSEHVPFVQSNSSGYRRGQKSSPGVVHTSKDRSRTFQGVADAMAEQWG